MPVRVKYWVPFVVGVYTMPLGLVAVLQAAVEVVDARTVNELVYYGLWLAVFGPVISYLGYRVTALSVEQKEE